MARKRKSGGSVVRPGQVLAVLVICSALASAGVGYVWHQNRNAVLEREIFVQQTESQRLRQLSAELDNEIAKLRTYEAVVTNAERRNLGLQMPQPDQILRLPEPTSNAGAARTNPPRFLVRAR